VSRAALLLAAALGAGCAATPALPTSATTASSTDFTLPDLEGRDVRLSDFTGRVVLVDFWATWCSPCVAALPALEQLHERYAADGLTVLSVAIDGPETVAAVGPFARRMGLSFPVLLDEESRVVSGFNPSRTVPFQLLVDRRGRIVKRRQGYAPGDEKLLEADLAALLKEP
jgi:thiol-disulfide isomerase/thioredoxin